ncbi:hypothetical protein ACIBBD_04170 [Streptomyces sp. NPDC051315]|uniref:hypothetical protein n=1 Tax=Streptomyces sp. NPDC051315 TaxID=3365650 RepID=UPI0037897789
MLGEEPLVAAAGQTGRTGLVGEITGFRTSVIFQQVSNTAPARLPARGRRPASGGAES